MVQGPGVTAALLAVALALNTSVHNAAGNRSMGMAWPSHPAARVSALKAKNLTVSLALHPFVTGQAFRARYQDQALEYVASHLGVWLTASCRPPGYWRTCR